MQIVIDVSEKEYADICKRHGRLSSLVRSGKVLPKGHGRLIDADDMELPPEELVSRMIIADAPTIIKADKEVDE